MKVGQNADLTVFRVDEANISVEDSLGDHLTLTQLIHPLLAVQGQITLSAIYDSNEIVFDRKSSTNGLVGSAGHY